MRRLSILLSITALMLLGSGVTAMAGRDTWTGSAPFATGLGNRSIKAFAVSGDGKTAYAGTGSGTVFSYSFIPSYQLSISIPAAGSGIGSGQVVSDTGGINCTSGGGGTCSATYQSGTTLTLAATTTSGSTFDGWAVDCSGVSPCLLAMTMDKNVTVQFGLGPKGLGPVAKITSTGYGSVNDACGAAGATDTIMIVSGTQTIGDLRLDSNKNVTMKGGYDIQFSQTNSPPSVLQGTITITSGCLRANGVKLMQ